MLRIFIFCFIFICNINFVGSIEQSYTLDHSPNALIDINHDESSQKLVVQSYSLENISNKPIYGIHLSINSEREYQKKQIVQSLLKKNNLWKWCLDYQSKGEKKGFYLSQVAGTLKIPTRGIPVKQSSLNEFYFDGKWQLIDNDNQIVYLSLDNHTLASYEDIADDPFLALRTKTSGLDNPYDFSEASANFARFDIFPDQFDCSEPSDDELELNWQDYHFDLYPQEKICFDDKGTIRQSILLQSRHHESNKIKISSAYPITQIFNHADSPIFIEEQNFLLESQQAYTFEKPCFVLNISADNDTGYLDIICAANEAHPWTLGANKIDLGINHNPGIVNVKLQYELCQDLQNHHDISVINKNHKFDYKTPYFEMESRNYNPEKIWWQISSDRNFEFLVPNLQAIQDFRNSIELDLLAETFLNPEENYYFRVKGFHQGKWSDWSTPFEFTVTKPEQIKEPLFKKLGSHEYQISWEPSFDPETQYHVFASNAFDFMPSIYFQEQYRLIDDEKRDSETVDNLIAVTSENSLKIGTNYAFYRIIAEKEGKYSVPSPIIRVYDYALSIPRSVLQLCPTSFHRIERIPFPEAYPQVINKDFLNLRNYAIESQKQYYTQHPYVEPHVWNYVKPLFLPENHPIKSKLDRLFSTRVTQNEATLKKAGFTNPDPMKFSKTIVTKNKNVPGYMFKFFSDEQKGISDWQQCLYRVTGALYIQDALNRYNINHLFVVPTKYIYPLPGDPSPPANLERKNFIVVENFLDIYTGSQNNRMWKSPVINPITLTWIYLLLQELGLKDSPYNFNMPITKDNRIAFVDTEHHHKWPVPFEKLWQFLSSDMGLLWSKMIEKGGP